MRKICLLAGMPGLQLMTNDILGHDQYHTILQISNPLNQLQEVVKFKPTVGTRQFSDGSVLHFPMIGDVYVSLTPEFKGYPTPSGAYTQARNIKRKISVRIAELQAMYSKREMNLRIIKMHYIGKGVAI